MEEIGTVKSNRLKPSILRKEVDGKMFIKSGLKSFVLICFINYGISVPIDYCLHPLDKNDCGLKPTPVFSYHKPGSRCEIEYWRGCPTMNKFPDEVICSHHCIGKMFDRVEDDEMPMYNSIPDQEKIETDECKVTVVDADCGVKNQFKYTFIDNLCIRIAWRGCESINLFDDEETCMSTCTPQTYKPLPSPQNITTTESVLEEILEDLPINDVLEINNILDNAMEENATSPPKLMLKKVIQEQPTEAPITDEPEIPETTTEMVETTSEVLETTAADATEIPEPAETTTEAANTTEAAETEPPTEPPETPAETTETAEVDAPTTEAEAETTVPSEVATTPQDSGSAEEVLTTF